MPLDKGIEYGPGKGLGCLVLPSATRLPVGLEMSSLVSVLFTNPGVGEACRAVVFSFRMWPTSCRTASLAGGHSLTRIALTTSTPGEVFDPVDDRDDRRYESEDLRCRLRVGAKPDDGDEGAKATPSLTISGRSGSHGTSSRSVTRIGGAWCENVELVDGWDKYQEGPACALDLFKDWVRGFRLLTCSRKRALIDLRALTRAI